MQGAAEPRILGHAAPGARASGAAPTRPATRRPRGRPTPSSAWSPTTARASTPADRERIFDPFFTTKPAGEGHRPRTRQRRAPRRGARRARSSSPRRPTASRPPSRSGCARGCLCKDAADPASELRSRGAKRAGASPPKLKQTGPLADFPRWHVACSIHAPGGHRMKGARSEAGFTAIEVIVVMAIVGIAAAMAVPSWRATQANSRLRDAAGDVSDALAAARARAIADTNAYVVYFDTGVNGSADVCGTALEDRPGQPGADPRPRRRQRELLHRSGRGDHHAAGRAGRLLGRGLRDRRRAQRRGSGRHVRARLDVPRPGQRPDRVGRVPGRRHPGRLRELGRSLRSAARPAPARARSTSTTTAATPRSSSPRSGR